MRDLNYAIAARWRLTVLGLALLAGCSPDPSEEVLDTAQFPVLETVTELRIGDVGDPNIGFSRIASADVDRDGNIFVLEATVPEIRVYDPSGRLLRRIGRRGGGPGEFESAPRFGVDGDTVWAIDGLRSRITLFTRSGEVLSTGTAARVEVPLPQTIGIIRPRRMRSDGHFTGSLDMIQSSRDDAPSGVLPTDRIPVPWVLFNAGGEVVDTIGWADKPPPGMWRPPSEEPPPNKRIVVDGQSRIVPSAPSPLPRWEPVEDGYIVIDAPTPTAAIGEVTVTRIAVTGDTVFARPVRYSSERYTAEELDSVAARSARSPGGMLGVVPVGGGTPEPPENWEEIARALRGAMEFPTYQNPVQWVWLGQDESIWLRWAGEGEARWVILNGDGSARGQVVLPRNATPIWSGDAGFLAATPDELDVQWLERHSFVQD